MTNNCQVSINLIERKDRLQFSNIVTQYVKEYQQIEKVYPVHFDPKIGQIYWQTVFNKPKKHIALVAKCDEQVVGFITGEISIFSIIEKAYFNGNKRGVVWDFYVIPQFRGQQIGTLLIQALETEFKKHKCFHIVMNGVSVSNKQAGMLYEKLGYRPWQMQYYKKV